MVDGLRSVCVTRGVRGLFLAVLTACAPSADPAPGAASGAGPSAEVGRVETSPSTASSGAGDGASSRNDAGALPADAGAASLGGGGDSGGAVNVACTSGASWTAGTTGGALHFPGRACVACHLSGGGPTWTVGGTVYPTAHEPDDCAGAGGAIVELTDANGKVVTKTTNANGSFLLSGTGLAAPYAAVVRAPDGGARASTTPHADFDCNGCHSALGASGAQGRLRTP